MLGFLLAIGFLYMIFMFFKRSRNVKNIIRTEIDSWVQKQIITNQTKEQILSLYEKNETIQDKKDRYIKIILTVGGLFIGIGLILFVASNWDYFSPLERSGMLIGTNILLYLFGGLIYFSKIEKYQSWGKGLILSGALCFGASIYLIAQIYNLSSHYPNGVLFWFLGTLPFLFIFKDKIFAGLSLILFILWIGLETDFYISVYSNPYKFIIAGIFIALMIISLAAKLSQNQLSFIPLDKIQNITKTGILIALIFSRFLYLDQGFLDYTYPFHLIALGIIGIILTLLIHWQERANPNYLTSGLNIFSIGVFLSIVSFPTIWNAWIFILIFECMICLYLLQSKFNSISQFLVLITYISSFLSFQIYFNDLGSLISIVLSLFALILFLLNLLNLNDKNLYINLSLVNFLSSIFILTFSDILKDQSNAIFETSTLQSFVHVIIPLSFVLLALSKMQLLKTIDRKILLLWLITFLLITGSFFLSLSPGSISVLIYLWNLIFISTCFYTIYLGFEKENTTVINLSLSYFAVWLIARYYDLFWDLMDRSIFFIGGGIILMIIGLIFERRKYFLKNISK